MKNKTNFVYIVLFLVIIFSFAIPKIITNLQDKRILSDNYTINKNLPILSNNTKQAKLINAIYSKYNSNKYDVNVSDTLQESKEVIQVINGDIQINDTTNILNNINELVQKNIITKNFYNQFSSEFIINRIWNYDNGEIKYSKVKIFTNYDYENAIASIEIEAETNKIIEFNIKKEYVICNQNSLQEYIKYLELDEKFADWEYIGNELTSRMAGVKVTTLNDGEFISFKLQNLKEIN